MTFSTRSSRAPRGYASLDYELIGYRKSRSGQGRYAAQRRSGRCAVLYRAHVTRRTARARQICRKAQGEHSASDVRNSGTGSHRQQGYCPRNRQGDAQGRTRQVLRRRYHAKEKAAGEAKGRQKAHACARLGTGAAGSLHGRTQAG